MIGQKSNIVILWLRHPKLQCYDRDFQTKEVSDVVQS
mgnify:CR=1 FL=1